MGIMSMDTALLVIDVQNGMFEEPEPMHDGPGLLQRIQGLIEKAKAGNAPVIYVQHNEDEGYPLAAGSHGWGIHPRIAPTAGEPTIQKHVPDAFQNTDLQEVLTRLGVGRLVIAGLQTDMCIAATAKGAHDRGYEVAVVKDGHSTWDQGGESAIQIIGRYNDEFRSFAGNPEASEVDFRSA